MSDLCTLSATHLAELLAQKRASSEELVRAHLDRIDRLDGKLRAFTEVLRDEALRDARRADDERARRELRGPLHGMPVSVKECFDMEGRASTLGVPARRNHCAKTDSAMVTALRRAGAVVLGRTNLSQFMIFHECRNPIFGQTANPFSLAHTPGGSSGGEAAAIAAGMSPLGVGTDIGGSIRIPAHFSGIAALKPTLDRWPVEGCQSGIPGQEAVRATAGPMARTARDVAFFLGALDTRALSELDGRVPPVPFDDPERVDVRALRVGYYVDDGLVSPSRAVARAVERARDVLAERGCTVVPFRPPGLHEAIFTYFAAMSSDGGKTVRALASQGAVDPTVAALERIARLPVRIRRGLARVLSIAGESTVASLLRVLGEKPVRELFRLTVELRAYRRQLIEAFRAEPIDILLAPAHATAALPHGLSKDFVVAGSYSMLFNLVQFPGGVVPVSRVRASETRRSSPRGGLERHAAKVDATSAGLPVGVQVIARPWHDADVLAAMFAIEDGVRGDEDFPRTPVEPR